MSGFRRCVVLGLALGLLPTGAASAADAKDLAGKYAVEGVNPAGETYTGVAEVAVAKGGKLEITWRIGKRTTVGTGRLAAGVLTVEYEGAVADREGKALYQVRPRGVLSGRWHTKGVKGAGRETLTPRK